MNNSNPLHTRELERRLHLDGYQFVTNARQAKRGGGVAIVINTRRGYTAKRLQVNCSTGASSLEVVWSLITPPAPINGLKKFV